METRASVEWWELGQAEGMALGLLTVLTHRGIAIPRRFRDRIASARDIRQLQEWVALAAKARTIYDVFPSPGYEVRRRRPRRAVRTSGWLLAGRKGAARRRWATLRRRLPSDPRPQPWAWPSDGGFPVVNHLE
jgi:hypothetical protein